MANDFNVNLNGKNYNENNLPAEIQLNGKNEKADILSVFDKNKDGKLSKSEIKNAILSILNDEKQVSGNFADSKISDKEADFIAKEFMNGKFKIGENFQKLVKELQNRISAQNVINSNKLIQDKLDKNGYNFDNPICCYGEIGSMLKACVIMAQSKFSLRYLEDYRRKNIYLQEDGRIIDEDANIIENISWSGKSEPPYIDIYGTQTEKINEKGQKRKEVFKIIKAQGNISIEGMGYQTESLQALNYKGQRYKDEAYSAKILGLKKENTESFIGSVANKVTGDKDAYLYSRVIGIGNKTTINKEEHYETKEYFKWDGEKFVLVETKTEKQVIDKRRLW